jgi:3,4-dihydroxyphthalate decarboxylase
VDAAHASPAETAIHGEIYRAHPEVMSVVHAHPYYALMCGVTRLDFRPVFGAYEPSALDMILKGVPVYPVARTVSNKQDAAHMLECMADRDVLLMQGHGITATGKGVAQSTTLAIRFDRTANIMWDLALSGLEAPEISQEDMDRYNRPARPLGGADEGRRAGWSGIDGAELWGWNHYVKMLETSNIGLPDDLDAE